MIPVAAMATMNTKNPMENPKRGATVPGVILSVADTIADITKAITPTITITGMTIFNKLEIRPRFLPDSNDIPFSPQVLSTSF
jgi:hypothetical protein